MTSPLARHLVRFSAPPLPSLPEIALFDPEPLEPQITLDVSEYESRLATARDEAQALAAADAEARVQELEAEHATAMDSTVANARAEWTAAQGEVLSAQMDSALTACRDLLCAGLADVLRPVIADALIERAVASLNETIDRLLADPEHPLITVTGPTDLLEAIKAARGGANIGIDYQEADTVDVTLVADRAQVETRLAAALSALSAEEH